MEFFFHCQKMYNTICYSHQENKDWFVFMAYQAFSDSLKTENIYGNCSVM